MGDEGGRGTIYTKNGEREETRDAIYEWRRSIGNGDENKTRKQGGRGRIS
jgi:hypothetical protein